MILASSPTCYSQDPKQKEEIKGMNSCIEEESWSTCRLTEELYLHLMRVTENDGSSKRKYQEQAKYLIYRIPVYRPTPPFIINIKDLTHKLKGCYWNDIREYQ